MNATAKQGGSRAQPLLKKSWTIAHTHGVDKRSRNVGGHEAVYHRRRGDDVTPSPRQAPGPLVRIIKPARSVMQAGQATSTHWVLEFESRSAPFVEPLMGWTGTADTSQQVHLNFPTKEQAVAFAKHQGWDYTICDAHEPRVHPKNYADRFRQPL